MALITINGKELQADDGKLILDVAREAGHDIPTFCYHAKLSKLGSCRMCLVEIEGMRKLQPACVTPVMDGMKIHTESPDVVQARKAQLEFLLINHPLDCPVCDQAGECDLQDLTYKFGECSGRFRWEKRTFPKRDMGQTIVKEMNRCIACRRCSRFCAEISGDYAIGELNRGNDLEMGTFCHTPIDSEFIGNTVQICPVGALTSSLFRFKARVWDLMSAETICPHCSVGCSITSDSKYVSQEATQMLHTQRVGSTPALDGTEVRVLRNRATEDKGVTGISLCDRGRYGYHFINSKKRLVAPLIREGDRYIETTWDKALGVVASKLSNIKERVGANAVAGITSGMCSNEEGYLFQKLFRNVIGTNNIDIPFDCDLDRPAIKRLGAMVGKIDEIRNADTIFVIGSSVASDTPVASMYAGMSARMGGGKLFIATPGELRLKTSKPAVLNYKGEALALIGSLILAVVKNKLYAKSFDGEKKKYLDRIAEGLKGIDAGKLAEATGVEAGDIEAVAKALSRSSAGVIVFGDDVLAGENGCNTVQTLYNLAALLGYNGEKGKIVYAPAGSNFKGSKDVGIGPDILPNYDAAGDKKTQEKYKLLWGAEPPAEKGLPWRRMLKAASEGKLKALYVMADDPVGTAPNPEEVRSALSRLDFMVVQDLFMTETAAMADVILPAVSYAEKEGTTTNLEGRVQKISRSIKPIGHARPDWQIISRLADKMGGKFEYRRVGEITQELARAIDGYEGLSLETLGRDGFFADTSRIGQDEIKSIDIEIPVHKGNKDYPFRVVPGRDVFFSGVLTRMDEGLIELSGGGAVAISENDGVKLGLKSGDRITVETAYGELKAAVKLSDRILDGVVFVPTNHPDLKSWGVFGNKIAGVEGRIGKPA